MNGLGQSSQPYNGGAGDPFGGDPFGGDPFGGGGPTFPFGTITNPLDVGGVLDALKGLGIDVQDVANWIGLGQRAIDLWNDIVESGGGGLRWSGRYCEGRDPVNDPCPGTPDFDAIWRAVSHMPQDDVDWLLHGLGSVREGPAPASRLDLLDKPNLPSWVCGVMGGQDCAHTTAGARAAWPEPYFPPDRHFVELVAEYGAPSIFGGGGAGAGGAIGAALPWLIGGGLLLAMLRR